MRLAFELKEKRRPAGPYSLALSLETCMHERKPTIRKPLHCVASNDKNLANMLDKIVTTSSGSAKSSSVRMEIVEYA